MPAPVGSVYATFTVDGLQDALTKLKEVAQVLDALNNKKVNLGSSTASTAQQATRTARDEYGRMLDADKAYNAAVKENAVRTARDIAAAKKKAAKDEEATIKALVKAQEQGDRDTVKSAEEAMKQRGALSKSLEESGRNSQRQLQQQISSFQSNMQTASKILSLPQKGLETLSKTVLAVGREMEHIGQITAIFGYRMSLVAKPLADLGVLGSKAAIDLETSVTKAATQLDDLSPDNVKKFVKETSNELLELSKTVPLAAKDMGDAVYYIVSTMSIDPAVARKMINPISEFATAIKGTAIDATKAVVPILNVYKEYATSADGVSKALSIMFETTRRGSGDPADIARQFGDFLAYGKTAGASLPQQSALFAQLTRIAGSPSEASTQLSAMLRGLTDDKTVQKLESVGIKVSQVVEGTEQWVSSTGNLDAKSQATYQGIINKLQGAEGVTGLYGQLNKAQVELARNQTDYNANQSQANARQLDDSRQKVDTLKTEIKYWEEQKAAIAGSEDAMKYIGQVERRDLFAILDDVKTYLDSIKDEQGKLDALQSLFPNVRATRGVLSLFTDGAMGDVKQWASDMVSATGRVAEAAKMMGDTVEARMTKVQNNLSASMSILYNDFIRERFIKIMEYVTQLLDAFNKASPELKEFAIQLVILATAAGPVSFAFGTLMIGLSQAVGLLGFLLSPVGIVGLGLAMKLLKDPIAIFKRGMDDAGGGMKGLATFLTEVAVQFGLVKEADAVKFLKDMGLYADGIDLKKVSKDAAEFADKVKDVAKQIGFWIDKVTELVTLIVNNAETIGLVVVGATALSWITKISAGLAGLRLAFAATGTAAATAAGVGGVGQLALALEGLPLLVTVAIVLAGLPLAIDGVNELGRRLAVIQEYQGKDPNWLQNQFKSYFGLLPKDEGERWPLKLPPPYQLNTDVNNLGDLSYGQPHIPGITPGVYGPPSPSDFWDGNNSHNWDGDTGDLTSPYWGVKSPDTSRTPGTKPPPSSPPGGPGPVPYGKTQTPQEMAPGIFKRMAGEGWMGAFAQEHGGQDAYSYYAGQGYSDPIGAALRDKAWGDDFAKRNGGKGPDKGDWETHWYQTYNKQEEDELDAEGKPTGKKKTTIKGPMDEFAKAVEDAMQGVIDKKEPFKEALTTGPQSVIDMKPQIDEGYNGITDGWQAMVDAVIAYMQRKTGNFETEWEDELDAEGKPTGKKIPKKKTTTRGDRDFGGPVVTSGVYRLLKGEYVVSMPEQRDIQSIVRQASSNNVNRGGDSYSIAINGANANPKDIASAVMAEMRWQQSRRSGKMVY